LDSVANDASVKWAGGSSLDDLGSHGTVSGVHPFVRRYLFPSLVMLAALAVGHWRFRGFRVDDELITYRLWENLFSGGALSVNTDEYVHGVSTWMTVMVGGVAEIFGRDHGALLAIHAVLGSLAAGWVVMAFGRRSSLPDGPVLLLSTGLMIAAPFSVWATSGLTGATYAATAGWAFYHLSAPGLPRRSLVSAGALLALLTWIRVDGFVLVAALSGVTVLRALLDPALRRRLVAVFGWCVLFPVAAWSTALLLQWAHYGTAFPSLVTAKTEFSAAFAGVGLSYLAEFLLPFGVFTAVAVVASAFHSAASWGRTGLLVAGAWAGYLVWVGGDWMPAYRHLTVVLVFLSAAVLALRSRAVLVFASVALFAGSVVSISLEPADRAVNSRAWLERCETGARMLDDLVGAADPLLAVEPIGCPSRFTNMRILDILGLFDTKIAAVAPIGRPVSWTEWQRSRNRGVDGAIGRSDVFIPGHGAGDGEYVWSQEPDLFLLCDPSNPTAEGCFRSWAEIRAGHDLESRYRQLAFDIGDRADWKVWVRWDAGPLGVRSTVDDVVVPAWLLAPGDGAQARRTPTGPVVVLDPGSTVQLPAASLPVGEWRVDGLAEGLTLAASGCVKVTTAGTATALRTDTPCTLSGIELRNPTKSAIPVGDLVLRPAG
jgi:hypothetical protein